MTLEEQKLETEIAFIQVQTSKIRAEIDKLFAETDKLEADTTKSIAETEKIYLEMEKMRRDARWYLILILTAFATLALKSLDVLQTILKQ